MELRRELGRWDLVFITVNSTVGAGILGLPGKVYALLGPYSPLTCVVGGALMGLVACCYAEAGSRFCGTGATYLYARAAFGPAAGFFGGWLAIATRLFAFASIMNLLIAYARGVAPALGNPVWRVIAITATAWGLGAIIYTGVRLSAKANAAFTVAKLTVLAGFALLGAALAPHLLPAALPPAPPLHAWGQAVALMMFGLIGLDSTVVNGAEMRAPRRDIPFGLFVGLAIVIVLYSAILIVCAAVVPDLSHAARPLYDGATVMLGRPGAAALVAGAMVAMSGVLFTILFIGPRMVFALADGGFLPSALARIHPLFATPGQAVLLHTALAWALAIGSNFLGALTASTLTRLMLFVLTTASAFTLRQRGISEQENPLILPGGGVIAVCAAVLCLWLMTQTDWFAWLSALLCLALGALVLIARLTPSLTQANPP
jgi:amino acid transporter